MICFKQSKKEKSGKYLDCTCIHNNYIIKNSKTKCHSIRRDARTGIVIITLKLNHYSIVISDNRNEYHIVENFCELAKKLWQICEIVCQQIKLWWRFLGDRVGSMQANELHKFTVTLTASHKLACA